MSDKSSAGETIAPNTAKSATTKTAVTKAIAAKPKRLSQRQRETRLQMVLVPTVFVLLIAAWEYLVGAMGISAFVLPAPSAIWIALYKGLTTGPLLAALEVTLMEILAGFAISAIGAIALGTVISQVRLFEIAIYPYVVAFQTMPKVAIAPLIVAWVGFGIESKIIIVALVSFFPMLVNTIVGLKSTSEDKIDLLRSLATPRWKIFYMVQLPEALPFIFAGLNIGIVLAVLGAIVGEFVGAKAGLGYQILQLNYNLDIAGVFAVLILLGAIGVVLDFATATIRRRVVFWHKELN